MINYSNNSKIHYKPIATVISPTMSSVRLGMVFITPRKYSQREVRLLVSFLRLSLNPATLILTILLEGRFYNNLFTPLHSGTKNRSLNRLSLMSLQIGTKHSSFSLFCHYGQGIVHSITTHSSCYKARNSSVNYLSLLFLCS